MSLNIHFRYEDVQDLDVISDVEAAFSWVKLGECEEDAIILKKLEQATIAGKTHFIDRFNCKLDSVNLSNGCKAALLVPRFKNKIIDLVECGNNARDIIISLINRGNILIDFPECDFTDFSNGSIDVICNGKRYATMYDLVKGVCS